VESQLRYVGILLALRGAARRPTAQRQDFFLCFPLDLKGTEEGTNKSLSTGGFTIHAQMAVIICSKCFKNKGLRDESANAGVGTADPCANCTSIGGVKLDETMAEELFLRFFCDGSGAAAYLPRVFTMGGEEADDIQFDATAQADYDLLKKKFGFVLRRHTPRTYELGRTWIRSELEEVLSQDPRVAPDSAVEKLRSNMSTLLDAASVYQFDASETLYRARVGPKHPLDPKEYDSPPQEKVSANRVAGEGQRVLCAALDIETCLIETKPHIDDLIHHRVFVASLVPRDVLKVLDFTKLARNRDPEVTMTLTAFFEANVSSYHLTQLLCSFAEQRGHDGICYPSAMECITEKRNQWRNVALFGAPIADGKLLLQSVNRVLIRDIAYSYTLGPVWEDDTEGNHLAPYLKGWLKRANWMPPAD
jgi:hypothetical protein